MMPQIKAEVGSMEVVTCGLFPSFLLARDYRPKFVYITKRRCTNYLLRGDTV